MDYTKAKLNELKALMDQYHEAVREVQDLLKAVDIADAQRYGRIREQVYNGDGEDEETAGALEGEMCALYCELAKYGVNVRLLRMPCDGSDLSEVIVGTEKDRPYTDYKAFMAGCNTRALAAYKKLVKAGKLLPNRYPPKGKGND